jgi:sigma-B regulation protein RsbU (phosphoserine phosphatase)
VSPAVAPRSYDEDAMIPQTLLTSDLLAEHGDTQQKLAFVVEMMRDLSRQTDPQLMVAQYGQRMRQVVPSDANMSLSRRDLDEPFFRITRSSRWEQGVNPWKHKDRLPVFEGGLIGRLIWGDQPVIIDDLAEQLEASDPALEYLEGYHSLVAIPLYDQGVALNMVILLHHDVAAYKCDRLPEHVWMSNLFGRATHSLVLSQEVRKAYDQVDKELKVVADIQRSLLPTTLPAIPTLDLACHYQTSTRAGGDYYDFFELPDGKWGVLIADVSGHGTPAAVIMAVTHSIAHMLAEPPIPPSRLMNFVNRNLTRRYTNGSGTFVTAVYGVYDPATRTLQYSSAGHPPPRVLRCGHVAALTGEASLPLGIDAGETYADHEAVLAPGDVLILYTDGITEARNPQGDMFGEERLDAAAVCRGSAQSTLDAILSTLDRFRGNRPMGDDSTLLVARVTDGPDDCGRAI